MQKLINLGFCGLIRYVFPIRLRCLDTPHMIKILELTESSVIYIDADTKILDKSSFMDLFYRYVIWK